MMAVTHNDTGHYVISDLPIDCFISICQFLSPKDLVSFSKVCKFFYESSLVGSIWRRFSLSRWPFCDVAQVSPGPGRWRRYFIARRSLERHFDQGRPQEDYRVKTLRGHEASVTTVLAATDVINWDDPRPPRVISLSSDGKVKCWDTSQAKVVWSHDDGSVTAIAADNPTAQLALSCSTNGTVTIWNLNNFTLQSTLSSIKGRTLLSLKYKHLSGATLPSLILMGYIAGVHPQTSCIYIWDPNGDHKPLIQLDAPPYRGMPNESKEIFSVSRNGCLAVHNDSIATVWGLPILAPQDSAVLPHTTVHCDSTIAITCWLHDNCLATYATLNKIDIWDVHTAITATRDQVFRYNESNINTPLRTISVSGTLTCLCPSRQVLLAGDSSGNVQVLNPTNGSCLQVFSKPPHISAVTDICADGARVVSCSKDFSIRVYRLLEDTTSSPKLESLYTLLGGSVAHKTHDGFWKVLCTPSSCLGVCGNQIKVYTFTALLASTVPE